jgi:transposase
MERDEESKGGEYSANSYLKVLKEEMLKCFKPGRVFMQNNASIHTAKKIIQWCEDNGILLLD